MRHPPRTCTAAACAAATLLVAALTTLSAPPAAATGAPPGQYHPDPPPGLRDPKPPPPPRRPHPHRQPWPITLTVQTVPVVAGARFAVDGVPLTTDAGGRAAYTREHNFASHTLEVVDRSIDTPDRRYRFTRWAGQRDPAQVFRPVVTGLPMRANYTVTAAFTVQYPVSARFTDQDGGALDPARISAVRVRAASGATIDLPPTGSVWLDGSQPTYRKSAVTITDLSYSLQSVVVDGANVVDAGRQRFQPAKGGAVTFTTGFHGLRVTAHDALFKGRVGTGAVVTAPDGTLRTVAFGDRHTATLARLPRGAYRATVRGTGGVVFAETFTLSRDRTVDVMVVTTRDLVLVTAAVLLVAAGLLIAGRRHLLRLAGAPVERRLRRWRAGRTLRRLRGRIPR